MKSIILFTNLHEVTIGDVRTHSNAMIFVDNGVPSSGPRYRAQGFRNEASTLTFDMTLPTIEYDIRTPPTGGLCSVIELRTKMGKKPVTLNLCLQFPGDEPLDIQRWDNSESEIDIAKVYETLLAKVVQYYRAPFILINQQWRIEDFATLIGVSR